MRRRRRRKACRIIRQATFSKRCRPPPRPTQAKSPLFQLLEASMHNALPYRSCLLIPGPVSLTDAIRPSMLEDHSAGEPGMIAALRAARSYLTELANAEGWGTAIPFPGSATYANEAVIR